MRKCVPSALLEKRQRKDEKRGKNGESHLSLLEECDVTKHVWIIENMRTPRELLTPDLLTHMLTTHRHTPYVGPMRGNKVTSSLFSVIVLISHSTCKWLVEIKLMCLHVYSLQV